MANASTPDHAALSQACPQVVLDMDDGKEVMVTTFCTLDARA